MGDKVAVGQLEAKEHIRGRAAGREEGSFRGWGVKCPEEPFISNSYYIWKARFPLQKDFGKRVHPVL